MRPVYDEYKVMFKLQGKLTAFHAEMLTTSSLGLGDPFWFYHDGYCDTYIGIQGEERCNEKGADILGVPEHYATFAKEFRTYIEMAKRDIIPRFATQQQLTKAEFRELLPVLKKFSYFYGITDFPYSEGMHQYYEKTKDPVVAANMEDFGKLKFEGRDILNAYMHDTGVFPNFLKGIALQFGLDESDGQFLYTEDILKLFAGEPLEPGLLASRREYYGCGFDGALHIFSYEEMKTYWAEFHPENEFTGTLKGVIANKGIARGRAVIAPMHTSPEDIARVVAKMNEGDVLIAESTTPELLMLCKKASAIVTDQGGMLSHAAVVSREFGKPCVIGTQRATHVFKDGDMVEVDADRGIVALLT